MRVALLALALALAVLPARADQQSAVAAVKANPNVIDAIPDNAGNLWVTVPAKAGIDWSRFAGLTCMVVQPHGARIFLVKVVDALSVRGTKDPKKWRLLGGANCGA
jgi:hypothetical protein